MIVVMLMLVFICSLPFLMLFWSFSVLVIIISDDKAFVSLPLVHPDDQVAALLSFAALATTSAPELAT